jgi:hypothetical protein
VRVGLPLRAPIFGFDVSAVGRVVRRRPAFQTGMGDRTSRSLPTLSREASPASKTETGQRGTEQGGSAGLGEPAEVGRAGQRREVDISMQTRCPRARLRVPPASGRPDEPANRERGGRRRGGWTNRLRECRACTDVGRYPSLG